MKTEKRTPRRGGDGLLAVVKKYFKDDKNNEMKFCPACGKEDRLWAGIASSTQSGCGCTRCKLKVERWWPKDWPRSCPKKLKGDALFNWMYAHCVFQCLAVWNRITRKYTAKQSRIKDLQ